MRKKALVTGATGFVGGHLVANLQREFDVRALVRKPAGTALRDVEVVRGDVTKDDGALERAAHGCDVVFHCAGVVGDRVTWREAIAVNAEGTRAMARAARIERVRRFIHVSSVAVYGFDRGTFDEDSPRRRAGEPYIDTKCAAEEACETELAASATSLRIVRPAIVYGPGDTGMVPRLAELLRRRVPLIGDGSASVGLVHVSDVVAALVAAAHHEGPRTIFNVAGPNDISWTDLTTRLASQLSLPAPRRLPVPVAMLMARVMEFFALLRLVRNPPPLTTHAVKFLSEKRTYETNALRVDLGIVPKVDVEVGLADVLARLGVARIATPLLAITVRRSE